MSFDPCGNLTIVINSTLSIPWSELPTPFYEFPGIVPAYLRPDGEALLPWIVTLVVILVHLPVVVLRVFKFQIVQIWCFVFTAFTIIIYIQAYVSTRFQAGDILVWSPLLLVIDAGSMSQVFFLINEDINLGPGAKKYFKKVTAKVIKNGTPLSSQQSKSAIELSRPQDRPEPSTPGLQRVSPGQQDNPGAKNQSNFTKKLLSALAVTFFLIIIALQILGLVYAVQASKNRPDPPQVRWCSPLFQPFGIAVRDGNCAIHPIDQSFNKGIGCIPLPGVRQAGWITGTIWGISISLVLQVGDVVILCFMGKDTTLCGVKMRRPYCTIIMGLLVLFTMFGFALQYSEGLPDGITSSIWVVVQAGGRFMIYEGRLVGAGMRGEVIGWSDALFKSWGQKYFGNLVP